MLVTTAQFLLSLSILVVLHEFGHFLPAKWFKTRVEKFYLFFDPKFSLFKKQIGETEWGIGWLPLGGYVKISGMIDESFDADQMQGEPQPWEFRSKPAWQRLIIMLGGVTVNFILGFLIFGLMLFTWGKSYIANDSVKNGIVVDSLGLQLGLLEGDHILKVGDKEMTKFSQGAVLGGIVLEDAKSITVRRQGSELTIPVKDESTQMLTTYENQGVRLFDIRYRSELGAIQEASKADQIGLKPGDQLLALNGHDVTYYHNFQKHFKANLGNQTDLTWLRGRDTLQQSFVVEEGGVLGIWPVEPEQVVEKFGFGESMVMGTKQGVNFITGQINAFGKMFTGKIKAKDSLGSFISIGKQFGVTWDWPRFWNMTAMLSLLLGFINLLPIPALDGGHVMFLLFESITGIKPSDRFLEYATLAGFILLVGFMIYALGLDISRHI